MNTTFKTDLKSKTSLNIKDSNRQREKEINLVDFRSYQKLFVVLISMFIILIIPESPRELGNICEVYNSRNSCNIW
tara:strand:- start:103 stop:330 length:228 start_codon:yes stop_codon:yes gene_type:complete